MNKHEKSIELNGFLYKRILEYGKGECMGADLLILENGIYLFYKLFVGNMSWLLYKVQLVDAWSLPFRSFRLVRQRS